MNQIDLTGRRAVVTGAAQGIGLAITERLLASGATVSLWDRDAPLLKKTLASLESSGSVSNMVVDVTDAQGVADALTETEKTIGTIDIMVNNAGIAGPAVLSWDCLLYTSPSPRDRG